MAPSRIDELRRRIQSDPASIAFAQLAEEYRRAGQTEEAVRVCREGLTRHPGYLSARVTLGRALLEMAQLEAARDELQFVVTEAPENLAAVRGLAEIFHREGQTAEAMHYYQRALALARHDPEIEEIVQQLSRQLGAAAASPGSGLSFEEAHQELRSAASRLPEPAPPEPPPANDADEQAAPFDFDRLVAALGSPAAPPQVDAAVAGDAAIFELPDMPSLDGTDPFAALEAELRANEAQQGGGKTAPWSSPDPEPAEEVEFFDGGSESEAAATPDLSASLAEVLADTLLSDTHVAEPDRPPVEFPVDPVVSPFFAPDSDPFFATGVDPFAPTAAAAEPFAGTAEPTSGEPAAPRPPVDPTATAEPAAVAVAPPPTRPANRASEGVLDELESWLTTLQDRSSH